MTLNFLILNIIDFNTNRKLKSSIDVLCLLEAIGLALFVLFDIFT